MNQLSFRLLLALARIEAAIRNEQTARAPDVWWLVRLKKLRLAAKDRLRPLVNARWQEAI